MTTTATPPTSQTVVTGIIDGDGTFGSATKTSIPTSG